MLTLVLRGFLAFVFLAASAFLSARFVLDWPLELSGDEPVETASAPTLSIAPISLGNPAAAKAVLHTQPPSSPFDPPVIFRTYEETIRAGRGDTLSGMLTDLGIDAEDIRASIQALSKVYRPRDIKQGQEISVTFLPNENLFNAGTFLGFSIERDFTKRIVVSKNDDGSFSSKQVTLDLNRTLVRSEGQIKNSLYVSGRKAGIPAAVLVELIRAYSWDVDFQRDIRTGDKFQVMFERYMTEEGEEAYNGNILFAALTLSGTRNAIYLHKLKDGNTDYFNEKGQSARKALMRTPIDGARLSSGYGRRKHPILGYTRMHRGVDFAAPRGTPIYAAGNGSITYAGWKGGYGKYIRIRHNGEYSTAYAHMRRFAKGMGTGRRVRQGQIIGYVGTTGRSTGPHLHYEIMRGGRQTNPLRVKMPSGRKLKGKALETFMATLTETDRLYSSLPVEFKVADK